MNLAQVDPKQVKKLEGAFDEMKAKAREDPVYFFDTFLYTFDPKNEPFHHRFRPFPFQKRLIRDIVKAILEGDDLFVEKCREMGVTYTVLGVMIWMWLWTPAANFLIGSRKEDYVDNRRGGIVGNKEESLFGKIDYMMTRLPSFILPEGYNPDKHLNFMSLVNLKNGNSISGESSNQNFSRGGRQRAILLDEFAFWENDCLREDTEVLTDSGWKLVKNCTLDDQVYSMDIDTSEAQLMPVTKVHKVYAEKLYEFKNKSVDISCTANHKLLIKKRYNPKGTRSFVNQSKDKAKHKQSSSKMYFRRADEVYNQKHDFIPLNSKYIGGETPDSIYGYKSEDFMEFLGWFISEGYSSDKPRNRKVGISQTKYFNIEIIQNMLERMGLPVHYYSGSFQIAKGHFPEKMFDELVSLGKAHQKHIPQKYLNYSEDLLLILFDSLIRGDGCRTERDGVDKLGYFTVSKRLADNVQELAQKIGLRASIKKNKYDNPKWKDLYRLNIGFKPHAQVASLDKKVVEYNDYAYCVTTPYHSLYIRRNGVASWCGNSAAWGSTADTTNCRIVLTTPGIRPGKAKRLRFGKDGEKIKIITLPYHLDPRKTKKWLEGERERRSTEDFNREIMINWELSITGRVYSEVENAAYGDFPFLQNTILYCSGDYGLDGTCFLFWQINPANGKARLIDGYVNEGEIIQFYFPLFGKVLDSKFSYTDDDLKAIKQISQYPKAIHFGDVDVRKKSFVKSTSTLLELQKAGIFVQSTTTNDFVTRRDITKGYLARGIEVNANARTDYILECWKMYRYPERKEDSQATTPVVKPIHDFTSHPSTAMEYFFLNLEAFAQSSDEEPDWAKKKGRMLTSRKAIKGRR